MAAQAGGARHDAPPPRLRRSLSAGLCPQARGAGLLAGHPDLHRRLPRREPDPEPRSRSPAAAPPFRRGRACARLLPNEKINGRPDLPLPPAGRARERSRLEHRARLEPLGRRRAPRRRPRAARRGRPRLPGLRGRGEELGRRRRNGSRSHEQASHRRHHLPSRRLAQLPDAPAGARPRRRALGPPRGRRPLPSEALEGLVIGGGDDIGAEIYGGQVLPDVRIDPERDKLELALLEAALPARACRCSASAAARR